MSDKPLISKDIVLWIEDNKTLVEARLPDLKESVADYGCGVEIRYTLQKAKEFLNENRARIALVILDLDIPESDVVIGNGMQQPAPTGLQLLKDYPGIPFIIFSAHPELAPTNYDSPLTPLAWLEKNAPEDNLKPFVRHILEWHAKVDSSNLPQDPLNRDRKTLICMQFQLQDLGQNLLDWFTPWDYLPLRFANTVVRESAGQFGGKLIGWSGTSAYGLFPRTQPDPDHFRTALQFLAHFWQKTCGPRSDRFAWNQWFIPVIRVGLLPDFADPAIRPEGAENLSVIGRTGDIVTAIASEIEWGEMAVPTALLGPGSRAKAAWDFVAGKERKIIAHIPYLGEIELSVKKIPASIVH